MSLILMVMLMGFLTLMPIAGLSFLVLNWFNTNQRVKVPVRVEKNEHEN